MTGAIINLHARRAGVVQVSGRRVPSPPTDPMSVLRGIMEAAADAHRDACNRGERFAAEDLAMIATLARNGVAGCGGGDNAS